jgi:hypothetical protein
MIRNNLLTALAAASMLAAPAAANEDAAAAPTKGEVKLAKLLEGRVAGEPRSCVSSLPSERIEVIDGTALVVGRGNTIYVNIPHDPQSLDDSDVLVIRRTNGTSLCRLDWIETHDRFVGFYTGNVMLSDFVPYTRVKDAPDEG